MASRGVMKAKAKGKNYKNLVLELYAQSNKNNSNSNVNVNVNNSAKSSVRSQQNVEPAEKPRDGDAVATRQRGSRFCSRQTLFLLISVFYFFYVFAFIYIDMSDPKYANRSIWSVILERFFGVSFCTIDAKEAAIDHINHYLRSLNVCVVDSGRDAGIVCPCIAAPSMFRQCNSSSARCGEFGNVSISNYRFPSQHVCLDEVSKRLESASGSLVPSLLHLTWYSDADGSNGEFSRANYLSMLSLLRYGRVQIEAIFVWNDGSLPTGRWWTQLLHELPNFQPGGRNTKRIELFSVANDVYSADSTALLLPLERMSPFASASISNTSVLTYDMRRKLASTLPLMLYGGVLCSLDLLILRDLRTMRQQSAAILARDSTVLRDEHMSNWPTDSFLISSQRRGTLMALVHRNYMQMAQQNKSDPVSFSELLKYTYQCSKDAFVGSIPIVTSVIESEPDQVSLIDSLPAPRTLLHGTRVNLSMNLVAEFTNHSVLELNHVLLTCEALLARKGNHSRSVVERAMGGYHADYYKSRCNFFCFPMFEDSLKVQDANVSVPSFEQLAKQYNDSLTCGRYRPPLCARPQRVAVLVTFRNRTMQLRTLLGFLHRFIQNQFVDYTVFVIEQAGDGVFNKGALYNSGYLEAQRVMNGTIDCVILHDVDLLPEDHRILYLCDEHRIVRHLSEGVDTLGYRVHYDSLVGGVTAIRAADYEKINGFSNMFIGWGAEDDDLYDRMTASQLTVRGYSLEVSRYKMMKIDHISAPPSDARYDLWFNGDRRRSTDGLNSIIDRYNATVSCHVTHTHVLITLDEAALLKIRSSVLQEIETLKKLKKKKS